MVVNILQHYIIALACITAHLQYIIQLVTLATQIALTIHGKRRVVFTNQLTYNQ